MPLDMNGSGYAPADAIVVTPTPSALAGRTQANGVGDDDGSAKFAHLDGAERMGAILESLGVRPDHVRVALQRHAITGEPLTQIMRDLGLVSGYDVARALALDSRFPYYELANIDSLTRDQLAPYADKVKDFTGYIPAGKDNHGNLIVLVPEARLAAEARNVWHNFRPIIHIATENVIQLIYRRFYVDTAQAFDCALDNVRTAIETDTLTNHPNYMQELVGTLLRHACYQGASDIWLWRTTFCGIIKLRLNGAGEIFRSVPLAVYDKLSLKIISDNCPLQDLKSGPVDALVELNEDYYHTNYKDLLSRYRFRLAANEEADGVRKMCIRILDLRGSEVDFTRLGFDQLSKSILTRATNSPFGLVLVTGPTGSGKTTTLYGLLRMIDAIARSVQTIENPVEYKSGLWLQNEVRKGNDEAEYAEALLKSLLRSAPDVILFGEIRNAAIAKTLLDAANTGHLVFTTLHTNNAVSAIDRLRLFGVDMPYLASVLQCVLAQRLVRKLCVHCAVPDHSAETMEAMGAPWLGTTVHGWQPKKAVGCPRCNYTGYSGRQMIYEVLDAHLVRRLIATGATTSDIAKEGLQESQTMWANGLRLVAEGITSYAELLLRAQNDL